MSKQKEKQSGTQKQTQIETEEQKQKKVLVEITGELEGVLEKLGLKQYVIFSRLTEDVGVRDGSILGVDVQLPYRQVLFDVSHRFVEMWKEDKTEVRHFIVHEAVHVLIARYTKLAVDRYVSERELLDEEETLVDDITHLLLNPVTL
jgi:hypothetical protein